jgi:hypothetical protein
MIIYKVNIYGDVETSRADKGAYGEAVYNTREYSPVPPPPAMNGKVPRLYEKEWIMVPDVRGTYYRTDNAQQVTVDIPVEVDAILNGFPLSQLTKDSPGEIPFPVWEKGAWKTDPAKKAEAEEQEKIQVVEALITEKQRELAKEELIKEGKLTEDGTLPGDKKK